LGRLYPDGTVDPNFDPGADDSILSMVLQADGKIVLGGEFTRLAGMPRSHLGRLNADGTLDPRFNPEANRFVNTLTLQPDGRILLGGGFSELAGEPYSGIARLLNPDPALQELVYNGSTVTWLRSGSTPEVWNVHFAYTVGGETWAPLPAPTRIAGGWELREVTLPEGSSLRAEGRAICGHGGGSSELVVSYGGAPVLLAPPAGRTPTQGAAGRRR